MTEREQSGDTLVRPALEDYEAMDVPQKCDLLLARLHGLFSEPSDLHHVVNGVELAAGLIDDPDERTGWINLPLAVAAVRPVSEYVGIETKYTDGNFSYRRTLIANVKSGFVHDVTVRSDGQPVHPELDAPESDNLAYMLACVDRLGHDAIPLSTEEVETVYTYK